MTRGFLIFLILLAGGKVIAHPALYHYLEINLLEPGEVSVFVTVHAPELSDEVAPLEADVFGKAWLSTRDDVTIAELVKSADFFVGEVFDFRFGDREVRPLFKFPDPEMIRHPGPDSAVPEGCFSGEVTLPYQVGEETLFIDFSLSAQKRLMLIINRPAAFPEVIDLEPGSRYALTLPTAPVPVQMRSWLVTAAIASVITIFAVALIRRRRACVH